MCHRLCRFVILFEISRFNFLPQMLDNYVDTRDYNNESLELRKSRRSIQISRSIKRFGHCQVLTKMVFAREAIRSFCLFNFSLIFGRFYIECRMSLLSNR